MVEWIKTILLGLTSYSNESSDVFTAMKIQAVVSSIVTLTLKFRNTFYWNSLCSFGDGAYG
jgi:hypothetical protein